MFAIAEIDDRISKCQKILDEDPNSQIFAALAEAYRKKGDLDQAFRVCRNGLKVHPEYGSAHLVMAKINLDQGHYDWAETEATKSAELDGTTRAIELVLAEIHIYKGEFKPAIKLLKKLHRMDQNNEQIKKLLEIAEKIPEEQTAITSPAITPELSVPTTTDTEKKDGSVSPPSLIDILKSAVAIQGVDGALFVNYEGLVVESEWTLRLEQYVCGASMAEIGVNLKQEVIAEIFGQVRTVLIETKEATFYEVCVDNGMFVFVTNETANLGSVRMKLENLLNPYTNKG